MNGFNRALSARQCLFIFALLIVPLLLKVSVARENQPQLVRPVISIIMDDLGYRYQYGKRAITLPAAITMSILPHAPHAREFAELAHQHGKEVMLHMPMESDQPRRLGPGGLTQCMTPQQLSETVQQNFSAIPYVRGFNNHMGSLLTRSDVLMDAVMKAAARPGIYFVDSRTTSDSVAIEHARQNGIHALKRDIFLDHFDDPAFIHDQLDKLVKRAREKGAAVAIGHPYKLTLQVLEQWLPQLETLGIQLVPVSQLIQIQEQRRLAWHESLSPLHRDAKN